MKRIKYKSIGEGSAQYKSIKNIPSSSGDLEVMYDLTDFSFHIFNAGEDVSIVSGRAVSNHELKKAIKKSLNKLGALVDKETRAKRKPITTSV